MKKLSIALFISIIITIISGCGGGGGGINTSPTPPPTPSGYTITVYLSNNTVQEGNEVYVEARVSPDPPSGSVITWSQEPTSPAGSFNPPSGFQTTWTAPKVSSSTTFTLKASLSVGGAVYFGVASITVQPQQAPPQNPPTISLDYPTSEQVVGSGTLLTILGSISQGSNPLKELQVLDSDNSSLQKWTINQPGDFRIDLSNFGSKGEKSLKIRIVDSLNLYSETQIQVINDDNLLEEKAREFLRKYNVLGDGGTERFGNLQTGPYRSPVVVYIREAPQYQCLIEEACRFWEKYTGIKFEVSTGEPQKPDVYIVNRTSEAMAAVAMTTTGYTQDPHEITGGYIYLYKGWLDESQSTKVRTLAHELGHALGVRAEVTEFGPMCVMWPVDNGGDIVLPLMQKAFRLLYEHPPAWTP
jgi:hypothetical protein